MMAKGEEDVWGWCGVGTLKGCGMALAKEYGRQFSLVVFAHCGLVWKTHDLVLSALSCILAFSLHV